VYQQTSETWIAADGSTVDNRITLTYDAVGNLPPRPTRMARTR
jgi:hypothetical protein